MSKEAYDKAMEELDEIAKSQQEPHQEELKTLDDLTKSLEEELGEDLSKSEDDDNDSDGDDDVVEKSEDSSDYEDELVKASEAYASLEKSVMVGMDEIGGGLDVMRKSMAALMNLTIKQAKVIAGQSRANDELVKSVQELAKSVETLGSQPVGASRTMLGTGSTTTEEKIEKSRAEIQDALLKAVQAGTVASQYLTIYGTYKDVNRLPPDVRQAIGI